MANNDDAGAASRLLLELAYLKLTLQISASDNYDTKLVGIFTMDAAGLALVVAAKDLFPAACLIPAAVVALLIASGVAVAIGIFARRFSVGPPAGAAKRGMTGLPEATAADLMARAILASYERNKPQLLVKQVAFVTSLALLGVAVVIGTGYFLFRR